MLAFHKMLHENEHENTITRRYLQNLASTSMKYTLFADRHSIFGKSTRKHAIVETLRDEQNVVH